MADRCKLCGTKSATFQDSHIIPQWMYGLLPNDGRAMKIASSHDCEFEQKSRTGIYGKYVCQTCEGLFSRWDNYASEVLKRVATLTTNGWDYGEYSYGDLTRFYLSVLWRASACGHKFFEAVNLKEQQVPLAAALLSNDDARLAAFDVWPSRSSHFLACGVLTPIAVSVESVPYWQLYMPLFQALIKVADQPGASCIQPHKLRPDTRLYLREKTFTEFNEENTAMQVFKANMEKKNEKRR